jgi:small subunit ribosomal protein S25
MLIDIDSKTNDEIVDHVIKVVGKSKETLLEQERAAEKKENPSNMGVGCLRKCICEIPGQVPCPGVCPLPKFMRGKYKFYKKDELAELENINQ